MTPQTENPAGIKFILFLIGLAVIGFCAYSIVSAVLIARSTGVLRLTSSDETATLSITQNNHQAAIIGQGKASVRLKPGVYQLSAVDNGYQTTSQIRIYKKRVTGNNLQLVGAASHSSSSKLFSLLPFLGPASGYQISQTIITSGNSSGPLLIITAANGQGRNDALQWISSQGYDPHWYNIQYANANIVNYHYTEGLPQ